MATILFFLSSGIFLGWSLGANDAANVFGTAVGTKMVRFKTAAFICGFFVIIGAVWGGAGAAHTLGKLGAVNALGGAFTVAFAAAFTVFFMTKLSLPVSTSQAIVGAIIGWNFFSGSLTDGKSLTKILTTWVLCPVLSAIFAFILYHIFRFALSRLKIHLFRLDAYTRLGLIAIGAFGSYSLGANNIANVMGVFVPSSPFKDLSFFQGIITFTGAQQLFLLGALAIAVGVFTYSQKVMSTVGGGLFKLSPLTALIVVLAESIVLFLFASEGLESWLINHGLPTIPLVPVSSSQAVVGGILGIGLAKGIRNVDFKVMANISGGWVTTPIAAGIITFIALFIMQNVFGQVVKRDVSFKISTVVMEKIADKGISTKQLRHTFGKKFKNAMAFRSELKRIGYENSEIKTILRYAEIDKFMINISNTLDDLHNLGLSVTQRNALVKHDGESFQHKWELQQALQKETDEWKFKEDTKINKRFNKHLKQLYEQLYVLYRVD